MPDSPKLSHVGIAVKNLEQVLKIYSDLGFKSTPTEIVQEHNLKVVQLSDGTVSLELMEPLDAVGPLAKYINSKGEGIHHLAFEVDDLNFMINKLKLLGYILVDCNKTGFKGTKIAFLHPKSTGGTLIELLEHCD
ncbi:methylmalonyl-CoA epimerase [Desulfolucanica intricata]|uniref:methylmalonyl-CoA epimerase n=1 Tax=Desulfolucanica intricata TaxID=1285191 RepID=UPI0008375198|nr:methylmalonyl-CoA epimerase [Desulfolucanica intricata]